MSEFAKCDLTLVCQVSWDKLKATDGTDVRHCPHCDKGVFKVRTRAQLELASQVGRCVALTDNNQIVRWIGKSNFDRMEEELEVVAIRSHHPIDAAMESRLRLAFPKVTEIAGSFPLGQWIVIGAFTPQVAENLDADILTHFPNLEIRERL